MGFILQWREGDAGRWCDCGDDGAVRTTAATVPAIALGGEVRVTSLADGWTVATSAALLSQWTGAAPPRALLVSLDEAGTAADRGEARFMAALRGACAQGVADGLLAPRQAQALASIGKMALRGAGPAGCTPDLDKIRPARLSSRSKAG